MNCPQCQSETRVFDSRPNENNTIRRRRVCDNGHRFTTCESTTNAVALIESRKKALRKWKSKQDMRAVNKRYETRRLARLEAEATGRRVQEIYPQWGVV